MTRNTVLTLLAALLTAGLAVSSLAGCEEKKDDAAEKPAKADSAEVIQGDKPTWPKELEGVEIGKPLAGAKDLGLEAGFDEEHWISTAYDDLAYFLHADDGGNIEYVRMAVRTDTDVAKKLADTWGAGATMGDVGRQLWFNPEAGLMAEYEPPATADDAHWLELKPYTPAATYIGTDKGTLGFTKDKPLLGKTLEEVKTEWADQWAADYDWIELQGTEFDAHGINVSLREGKDGKVDSYSFDIEMPDDHRQPLIDQLKANLGEPVEGEASGKAAHVFLVPDKQMRVVVPAESEGRLEVEVQRYMPLAAMIGDDKTRLALEGEAGWIGKLAESDWAAKVANDGDTLWATATEYDDSHFIVSPRFKDGTLSSYRFSIDCDLQPKACPNVLETFKKAFGEPTEQEGFGGTKQLVFANEPQVTLEADKDNTGWTVRVGAL